jgi:condensin complex subunit 2
VTLADFKFSADAKSAFNVSMMMNGRDDDDDDNFGKDLEGGSEGTRHTPGQDFFGDDGISNDFAGDTGGDGFFDAGDDDNDAGFNGHDDAGGFGGPAGASGIANDFGPSEPFDPRSHGGPSSLFMSTEEGQGLMLDHFDEGYLKNWAGPEHWKLRRVRRGKPRHGYDVEQVC